MSEEQRKFIRHPSDIPVAIASTGASSETVQQLNNVSNGGLSCESSEPAEPGSLVKVRVPSVGEDTICNGRIAWCDERDGKFQLGIEFLDPEGAFSARMCEQVCHIEQYRRDVLAQEGRDLTSEEAAEEWIAKNAADFPR